MFCPHCGESITDQPNFCPKCGQALYSAPSALPHEAVDPTVTWLLWGFLGTFGAHRFYLGQIAWGVAYLLTGGFCGIGWLIDLFFLPGWIRERNAQSAPVADSGSNTALIHAVLVSMCCCMPCGIVAIVYACKANTCTRLGDAEGAERLRARAETWSLVGFIIGLISNLLLTLCQILPPLLLSE